MNSQPAVTSSPSLTPTVQEYTIRVPKNVKKKFHVMRFNPASNVDFTKWGQVKLERENNIKEFKNPDEEQPKFGAGSEYGREAREEARRKKYGIITRKYKPEDQPWILKVGGKTGKKFKGIREGGVAENASYYVFTHAADGGIEAYPLNEWYNFQPIQRYKALSAEEAEQEFGRRNKVMNYFSLMLRKRLKKDEELDGEDEGEIKPKKGRKSNELKISEMDDWVDSDDEDDSEEGGEEDDEEKKEKKAKKKKAGDKPKPKKQKGSDESAFEESDDGDEEGRELDYISDSSESDTGLEEKLDKEMKGVAEESALRRLLTSDEDEDEEEKKEEKKEEEKANEKEKDAKEKDSKKRKKKTKKPEKKKAAAAAEGAESSSDTSADSSDSDAEGKNNGANNSQAPTPDKKTDVTSPAKKQKLDIQQPMLSYGGENGITEEAVRKYLMRKPMTTTELLQKFKGRKTGLSSEQLVNVMTQILKKISPTRQTIKNKMYLSLKPQP